MDNATYHKRSDIKNLIEEHDHTIFWLHPYSPDLNPIYYASLAFVLHSGEVVLRKTPRSGMN